MRVLLSTYDSRGGIEPLAALAVRLQAFGAEAVVCAPPDCAARLDEVGVPLVPTGDSVRELVHGDVPPAQTDVARTIDNLIATWFEQVGPIAAKCDAVVASGVVPAAAAARSVAELAGIPSVLVHYCPIFLPSPHHRPQPLPGRAVPPEVTDPRELNELDIENYNAAFGPPLNAHRVAHGLPPVNNVRDFVKGHPWLAADPVLAPWPDPDTGDVTQTGAWILPDDRPLPPDLVAWLAAGPPPVYVSFGSMRAPQNIAGLAVEVIRAHGHRALIGSGWAGLTPPEDTGDCFAVGEVNQQALFARVAAVIHHGGAGTTTTATRAGVPQVVVPQWADQPYFARRVTDLSIGAGVEASHDGSPPSAEALSSALAAALTPATRERAAAVAGTIRTDGAEVAAHLLLDGVG
ncbi:MAG: glycosyltransferase family 1 protein [Actinobacteria bacterium]|nr:glycosyltransferase family 1 protein [Actinomycetota bacterium]